MSQSIYPAPLLCDFYKISHKDQYPLETEIVYSTWIPRASKIDGIDSVVAFGFRAFAQKYLIDYFNKQFFWRTVDEVCAEYERVIRLTLGVENPSSFHLRNLWHLGYLPLSIRAVPEGTRVPLRVPMLTIENTHPDFFWLTNWVETLFSAENWHPATSATIAAEYRDILDEWCERTGGDHTFVPFQGHDFSMRGMTSVEAAAASGAGHLLSFVGTDTIPAILFLENHYEAPLDGDLVGTSIPATEHSVMCAYGQDELASYRRIISEVYPEGFVSIVSDTWDLWKVLTEVIASLKDDILARNGKVVIRPDSGDPVDIICGTSEHPAELPAEKGVIEILWDIFGGTVNEKGYKVLDPHIGAIYGDSITLERCQAICARLAAKGFASTNVVYGIGSYTYQYVTRDTFGFALKSTWAQIDGKEVNIFKDPVTDDGTKKSLTGRVSVVHGPDGGLVVQDGLTWEQWADRVPYDVLQPLFVDGQLVRTETLAQIRARLRG